MPGATRSYVKKLSTISHGVLVKIYWKKYPDSNMQNYYNHVKCKIGNALRIMTGMEKNIAPKTIFYWISINSLIVVIQYFLMQKTTPNFKIGKKKMNFVLPSLIHYSKTYLGH